MSEKRTLLVGLLVAVGLYSSQNALFFVNQISESETDQLVLALSEPHLERAVFCVATTFGQDNFDDKA